ncbi:MAG TPA: response regulator [Gemmatimonadales bacterium]|nr:response regulator [Gemmatimonadales bacterium]
MLVEDMASDAELIARALDRAGFAAEIRRVQTEPELTEALRTFAPALLLTDHSLPRFSAREALRVAARLAPGLPVIVVTGSLDEETAAEYIRAGATDYVVKERLFRLGPAVRRALELAAAHRREATAEARFRALIENGGDVVIIAGADQVARYASPSIYTLLGVRPEDYVGKPAFRRVHHDDAALAVTLFRDLVTRPGARVQRELRVLHTDGSWRLVSVTAENRIADPNIGGVVAHLRDITDQRRAEEQRLEADRRFRELVGSAPLGICQATVDGRFLLVNRELARILGYESQAELAQRPAAELYADPAERDRLIREAVEDHRPHTTKVTWRRRDGSLARIQLTVRAATGLDGTVRYLEAFARDVTTDEKLDEQYRQSQKLEAVGRLAGGVAHDFNNVLTAILGSCDLVTADLPPDAPARGDIAEIRRAGERAVALTRKLLAFSRLRPTAPVPLDVNSIIQDVIAMLRRLLGEDITIDLLLASDLGTARADPGELEQVLMNLAVNARDAMPDGGRLLIETANVQVDDATAARIPDLTPGPYLRLVVSDTGTGIPAGVLEHIFEPFFTTKEMGKGTGLGLATVYGIVRRAGGQVVVETAEGQGTSFLIYLPRITESPAARARPDPVTLPRGSETLLVVEDEDAVRRITRRVLQQQGYHVLEAAGGDDAIRIATASPEPIHLLVTDVVMPGMGGRDLAERLRALRPGIRVLYLSGYADDAAVRLGVVEARVAFLEKPYTVAALAQKVREVLDGAAP